MARANPVTLTGLSLFDSYHCSRYNTNTGVLTETMFRQVFASIRAELDREDAQAPAWVKLKRGPRGRAVIGGTK